MLICVELERHSEVSITATGLRVAFWAHNKPHRQQDEEGEREIERERESERDRQAEEHTQREQWNEGPTSVSQEFQEILGSMAEKLCAAPGN